MKILDFYKLPLEFAKFLALNFYPVQYNNEQYWTTWDWGGACPFNPTFPPGPLYTTEKIYEIFLTKEIKPKELSIENSENIIADFYKRFPGFVKTSVDGEKINLHIKITEITNAYFNQFPVLCGRVITLVPEQ